jgi:hypothetical protein
MVLSSAQKIRIEAIAAIASTTVATAISALIDPPSTT